MSPQTDAARRPGTPDGATEAGHGADTARLARAAQRGWAETPLADRLAVLRRLRHGIAAADTSLAAAVQSARGGPAAEALAAEVLPLAEACQFLERSAATILRPRKLGSSGRPAWLSGVHTEVRREPFGVVLVVGPGNYPLFLPGAQAVQALAAGNAVLVKPAPGCTGPVALLARLCRAAGLPDGLLQILPEDPAAVTDALDTGADKVILTGSAATGRVVLAAAAERIVPAVAELSGCDAAFVLPAADLDRVTRALKFSLRWNRGETCIAARRVFVVRELAGELERRLTAAAGELADGWQPTPASARAAPLVRDALARGARLVAGAPPEPSRGLGPTVLADVPPDARLFREDAFAPVLALAPVRDGDEALSLAALCPYALGAAVFGGAREAADLARRVRAGVVLVNDVIVPTADPRLPFGGRGRSGFGVTRGAEGLLEMTTLKVVARRHGVARHLEEPHPTDGELFHRYLQAAHGPTWHRRARAWLGLFRFLARRVLGRTPQGDDRA